MSRRFDATLIKLVLVIEHVTFKQVEPFNLNSIGIQNQWFKQFGAVLDLDMFTTKTVCMHKDRNILFVKFIKRHVWFYFINLSLCGNKCTCIGPIFTHTSCHKW